MARRMTPLLWLLFVLTTEPKVVQEWAGLFSLPQSRVRLSLPTVAVNTDPMVVIL